MRLVSPLDDQQHLLIGKITVQFTLLDALVSLALAHLQGRKDDQVAEVFSDGFRAKAQEIAGLLKDKHSNKPYASDLLKLLSTLKNINQRRVDVTHGFIMFEKPETSGNPLWVRARKKNSDHTPVTSEFLETLLSDMMNANKQLMDILVSHDILQPEPLDKSP